MSKGPDLIVLLSGKRKCGKDFVANLLQQRFKNKCELLHLSEPIKSHFSKIYNYDKDSLMSDRLVKENIRKEMIVWGENQRKLTHDPHIFCRQVVESLKHSSEHDSNLRKSPWIWIVVDCRRKTDLEYFYSNFQCKIISVRIWALLKVRVVRGLQYDTQVDDAEIGLLLFGGCHFFANGNQKIKKSVNNNSQDRCIHEKFENEVTFKGGIHAGNYIDQGKYLSELQCLNKCCDNSLCDAVFMLNNSCYLVTCSTIASCTLQKAKPTQLNPKVAFVTRWNSEGVRRTLFGDDRQLPWNNNTCPNLTPLHDVTLKNGLEAGVFTDSGKTNSLEDCYNVCCQRKDCNMAFLLADNCFTIKCHKTVPAIINMNKVQVCETEKAAASSFNPKAAHVYSRIMASESTGYALYYPSDSNSAQPSGAYTPYDNKEWLKPNENGDAYYNSNPYQYQPLNPPQIPTYQPNDLASANQINPSSYANQYSIMADNSLPTTNENIYAFGSSQKDGPPQNMNNIQDAMNKYSGFMFSPNIGFMPLNDLNNLTDVLPRINANVSSDIANTNTKDFNVSNFECPFTRIFDNSLFRDELNAGKFEDVTTPIASNIFLCQQLCCQDKKCDAVVMIETKCYKVQCESIESCTLQKNPSVSSSSGVNGWQIVYVRNAHTKEILRDANEIAVYESVAPPIPISSNYPNDKSVLSDIVYHTNPNQEVPTPSKSDYYAYRNMAPIESTQVGFNTNLPSIDITNDEIKTINILEKESCSTSVVHKDSTVAGGKEAGTMIKLADNSNIEICAKLCCSMPLKKDSIHNQTCHVALMIDLECYGISCKSKELCTPTKDRSKTTTKSLVIVRNVTQSLIPSKILSKSSENSSDRENENTSQEPDNHAQVTLPTRTSTATSTTTVSTTSTITTSDRNIANASDNINVHQNCYHEIITKNKTLVAVAMIKNSFSISSDGIDKAIKELANGVSSMERCIQLCCDNTPCEAAVLHKKSCISIECSTSPSLCRTTSKSNPHENDEHSQVSIVKRNTIPMVGNQLSAQDKSYKRNDMWIMVGVSCLGLAVMAFAIFSVTFYRKNYLKRKNKQKKHSKIPKIRELHQPRRHSSIFPTEENILEELLSKASKSRHIKPTSIKNYKK